MTDHNRSDRRRPGPIKGSDPNKGTGPMSFGFRGASSARVGPDAAALVETHWRQCAAGRRVACRGDIDPGMIDRALPATMILERIAPGVARIRVAGQEIAQLCGMDPRGMPLTVLFQGAGRDMLRAHLEATFSGPAIVSIPLTTPRRLLRQGMTGQLLLLPLDDGFGEISRALAVLITDRAADRHAPVRFDISADVAPRIEVLPPVSQAPAQCAPRREPNRAETEVRRAARDDLRRRFRLFEVVEGSGSGCLVPDTTEPRPSLSLVVSNP